MHCNAPPLVHTMLYPLTSYVLDLSAALVATYLGSVSSAFLPGSERLPTRTRAAREYDGVSLFAITPEWDNKLLKTSISRRR